ncbi:MAG: threonine--tRNA ligase [Chitinispirillaceae bacterium]|nr:threonine--tRNA ligase [Chitinispirillaceae bacterium]
MRIILPDGKTLELPHGSNAYDAAKAISPRLAEEAIAVAINGEPRDLVTPLNDGDEIALLTFESSAGKSIFWHSSSHVMAQAVQELFPEAKIAIGPSIENGFYYDFDSPTPFSPEDLAAIEKHAQAIAKQKIPFERRESSHDELRRYFAAKNEPYKLELLQEIKGTPSIYRHGEWLDLCKGPHLPHTGYIKAFKIISTAGAYWRGTEKKKMLQRIYGISFPKESLLKEYSARIEEAQKRDHRKLGKELDLFSVNEAVGPGLVLWHPRGGRLRTIIEDFWRSEHFKNGYEIVYSPHLGRAQLWETSGHLGFYREYMYSPMEIDEQEYFIKPMNCPFHIMMYKNAVRSYRELPFRWAELGTVYRYEKSGVLHGLLRVRGFTQDDAHLICRPDQMPGEIRNVLRFCIRMLNAFGFETFKVYLATRPKEKAVGDEASWRDATVALEDAVSMEGLECEIDEGGGAFYGPKIDIKIKDALYREWQCSTIQFDFNEPERFDMVYTGPDNEKQRPYMIHRALLGSLERFMGVLIEHYAGALPCWLAPVQVRVLPISDKFLDYARSVQQHLHRAGVRAGIDERNEKIGYKIRDAEVNKIPFMAVVGEKEQMTRTVAVRKHGKGDQGVTPIDDFTAQITALGIPPAPVSRPTSS